MSEQLIRICIIMGTRPEAIKLAPVIKCFQQSPYFATTVVLTGQHREMVAQVMDWFGLEAHHNLDIMHTGQTLTDITSRSLQGLEAILQGLNPQLVLVQGDTTTAFAAALAAFYQKIPVGHVEAGLRTNSLYDPYPEEANRRLISQLATLHFAPTEAAVNHLKNCQGIGEIFQTGNTVIDALKIVAAQKPTCPVAGLDWKKYRVLLATVHRRENWGQPLHNIADSFLHLIESFADTALLLPLHLNPVVREPLQAKLAKHPRIFLSEPLDYPSLVGAMQRCMLVLTDSGGLQEEAPAFGKPVLVLRQTTERPEAIMAGTAQLVGTDPDKVINCTATLLTNQIAYNKMAQAVNPFGDGHAADRIMRAIQFHFDVN